MARNKSEKRTPDEQAAYDYIKAWVEYTCTPEGDYKEGATGHDFVEGPGGDMHDKLSPGAGNICSNVFYPNRFKWLHAQK